MNFKSRFTFRHTNYTFAVVIPGLSVGMTKNTLNSLNTLGRVLSEKGVDIKLQVFVHTWRYSWNKAWGSAIVEYVKGLEYIDLNLYYLDPNDNNFQNFVQRFFTNFGIKEISRIPQIFYKPLSVFYISRDAIFRAHETLRLMHRDTQWVILRLKAPSSLPDDSYFENGAFFNSIEDYINRNFEMHTSSEHLVMKSPLDCLMLQKISSSCMTEHNYVCGVESLLRVYRYSYNELADSLAQYFKNCLSSDKKTFNSIVEFKDTLYTPISNSTEGGFIFNYLVKTADPKVNYIHSHLLSNFGQMKLQSPNIFTDQRIVVTDNNIVEKLNYASDYYNCEFVLSKEEYQKLNYNII